MIEVLGRKRHRMPHQGVFSQQFQLTGRACRARISRCCPGWRACGAYYKIEDLHRPSMAGQYDKGMRATVLGWSGGLSWELLRVFASFHRCVAGESRCWWLAFADAASLTLPGSRPWSSRSACRWTRTSIYERIRRNCATAIRRRPTMLVREGFATIADSTSRR